MRVIGAFVDKVVGELAREWFAELPSVSFYEPGNTPEEVNALCDTHRPDVILIGGEFMQHIDAVRAHMTARDIPPPLWIALVGPPKIYSRERASAVGVHTEIRPDQMTNDGWNLAVASARRALDSGSHTIRIVTAFPTVVPNNGLVSILAPFTEFSVGSNYSTADDLLRGIAAEKPHLVALGHQCMDAVGSARVSLQTAGAPEPRWVLMLSHVDPATLISAAMIGIGHMFTSEQFDPAERFAAQLREYATTGNRTETPLSQAERRLELANDEDDRKILRLLVSGMKNEAIAREVFMTEQSVKNRLSRMMKAAGVSNRTELALLFASTKPLA